MRSSVCRLPWDLHEADDHIGTPLLAPVALVEHGIGLADPCGGAEIEAEVPRRLHLVAVVGGCVGLRVARFDARSEFCH